MGQIWTGFFYFEPGRGPGHMGYLILNFNKKVKREEQKGHEISVDTVSHGQGTEKTLGSSLQKEPGSGYGDMVSGHGT